MFAAACSTPTQRIETEAQRAGFERSVVQGASFHHVVFARGSAQEQALTVFLEGDGLPWVAGRVPASDPTPRDPLALHLAMQSSGAIAYVGRPCYQQIVDSQCSARSWTFDRYSDATIDSMTVAIASQMRAMGKQSVRLIGYSGGGVLAVLIAERLSNVTTVITIGANLDTDAWAAHHGYLPLDGSLNPARSTRPHPWTELHLQGALDVTVPVETTRAYFERFANAKRLAFDDYDHVCCWVRDWPRIQARFEPR
jgi:pimeloyl-ACP methyl ester carboxylesterase